MCFYVELQAKIVRPRKNHECEWCGEPVLKGEKCNYRSFIFEQGPQSGWSHPECWLAMAEQDRDVLCEGWMPGDFQRGSIEQR